MSFRVDKIIRTCKEFNLGEARGGRGGKHKKLSSEYVNGVDFQRHDAKLDTRSLAGWIHGR